MTIMGSKVPKQKIVNVKVLSYVEAVEGVSNFGNPEPRVELKLSCETSRHTVNAVLYSIASALESCSVDDDPWVVVVDKDKQNVHLELVFEDDNRAEVTWLGMQFLHLVLKVHQ